MEGKWIKSTGTKLQATKDAAALIERIRAYNLYTPCHTSTNLIPNPKQKRKRYKERKTQFTNENDKTPD